MGIYLPRDILLITSDSRLVTNRGETTCYQKAINHKQKREWFKAIYKERDSCMKIIYLSW